MVSSLVYRTGVGLVRRATRWPPDTLSCCSYTQGFRFARSQFCERASFLVYGKIDTVAIPHRPDNQAMESALLAGDLGKVAENVYNVFDPVVTSEHLELNYIKSICNSYGALTEQMTGSGSAIFAILPNFEYAAVVCSMLKENYPNIYIAKPV